MKFWWVNHSQTFQQEFGGQYVWCPKRNKRGHVRHSYEMLREIRTGDLVFSYAKGHVRGGGLALSDCYSFPQPEEFGRSGIAWNDSGWRADIAFKPFEQPLDMKKFPSQLPPLLPKKYSPIRADGRGNQPAYFCEIGANLALFVLQHADHQLLTYVQAVLNAAAVQEPPRIYNEQHLPHASILEMENKLQHQIDKNDSISKTQRTSLIQARFGQGRFRADVLEQEPRCRLTGISNPRHLIASHIHPWREADDNDRLNRYNGLMLTPNADHLFDRGYISFDTDERGNGQLLIAPRADNAAMKKMGLQTEAPVAVGSFNEEQQRFLAMHRDKIFLSPRQSS